MAETIKPKLTASLRQLRLPAFVESFGPHAVLAAKDGASYEKYLLACANWNWLNARLEK